MAAPTWVGRAGPSGNWPFLARSNTRLPCDLARSSPGVYPKEMKARVPQTLAQHVYGGLIHNRQDLESTQACRGGEGAGTRWRLLGRYKDPTASRSQKRPLADRGQGQGQEDARCSAPFVSCLDP